MSAMLLVCPSCKTRYVVPDTAIGIDGRSVRCANCKHSWFQPGVLPQPVVPAPPIVRPNFSQEQASDTASIAPPPGRPPLNERPATASPAPINSPVQDEPTPGFTAFDDPVERWAPMPSPAVSPSPAPIQHDEAPPPNFAETPPPQMADVPRQISQFAHEPPFKPRRNPAKLWTMAAIVFATAIAALAAATWYFGVPIGSFSSGLGEPDLKIEPTPNLTLQYRGDGTPFFIASGSIVNPTSRTQKIPNMKVTLKDASDRAVYSWTVKPKKRNIPPGGIVDFSEAQLDVPRSARKISIIWILNGDPG